MTVVKFSEGKVEINSTSDAEMFKAAFIWLSNHPSVKIKYVNHSRVDDKVELQIGIED